jgi:ribosomal protein L11 methylase PrmA
MTGIIVEISVIIFALLVLYSLSRGAIYLPTQQKAIRSMLELAHIQAGMKVADLGSGDGRVVIAFAQAGCTATGFEFNPILSLWSKFNIHRKKLSASAQIKTSDFWFEDLSQYDVIIVFGMTHIMAKLSKKFLTEGKTGAIIISNIFKLPDLTKVAEIEGVRAYTKKE